MKRFSHRRTRRSGNLFRRIGNQQYRSAPGIRKGAQPPNAWEDYHVSKESRQFTNHIQAMIAKGWSASKITDRVCAKWGLDKSFAINEVAEWIAAEHYTMNIRHTSVYIKRDETKEK